MEDVGRAQRAHGVVVNAEVGEHDVENLAALLARVAEQMHICKAHARKQMPEPAPVQAGDWWAVRMG